jgi:hypothetical protein
MIIETAIITLEFDPVHVVAKVTRVANPAGRYKVGDVIRGKSADGAKFGYNFSIKNEAGEVILKTDTVKKVTV